MVIKSLISVLQRERVDEFTFKEEKSDLEPKARSGFQYIRSDVAMGGGILGWGLALTGLYLGLMASGMHLGSSIHMSILGHPIPPPPTSLWIASAVTQGAGSVILGSGAAFNLGRNLREDLRLRREETAKMAEKEQLEQQERFQRAQENLG